jgi:2,4-dienoyl-CoA reductase-like NADH-dependent reductase (Old Yellow Enzyme family)/thioredoxin reductase
MAMDRNSKFPNLFTPGKIKNLEMKNRLVMAPMAVLASDKTGYPSRQMIDYYCQRAMGGVGLIIVEAHWVLREYAFPYRGCLGEDDCIPKQKELVDAVHAHGCKIAIQMHHLGVSSSFFFSIMEDPKKYDVVAPSAIPFVPTGTVPRELSKKDIQYFVEAWGEAARRAKAAGYDAVEIHGAHGYLISQFLSPFTNQRTDEYGGSVKKRAQFALEVIKRVREKVGPDYPILMKINAEDGIEYGKKLEETLQQAPLFAQAGVDALDVSCGISGVVTPIPLLETPAYRAHLAESVKKVVNIPVIAVGRLKDPFFAEKVVGEGKADFIALGRSLLADPELPNKVKDGRLNEIVRCLTCNNCTERKRGEGDLRGVRCTVNPSLLRESNFPIKRSPAPKKVMVIGGGAAGMEAARVLAKRGHQTCLYEQSNELGGQWSIASKQEFKEDYATLTERLSRSLAEAGVKVTLNKKVTPNFVKEMKPDVVVLATGAVAKTLSVPGVDGKNVVQAYDVILGKAKVGERVVVVGGRLVGMEVALSLARQGKKVSIVTLNRLGENGKPMNPNIYLKLRDFLLDHDVRMFPHTSVHEIRNNGVVIVDGKELLFLRADTIVLAVGAEPDNKLAEEIRNMVPKLYRIGDCVEVRTILDATNEGAEVGREI